MKKRIGTMVLVISVLLCGCGNNEGTKAEDETKADTNCREIMEEVLDTVEGLKTDATLYYGEEKYADYFEYLYDTSPDRAKDGAYAYASASYADEITIIFATEEDDVSVIEAHLEDRVERRIRDFTGYEPDEVAKLEEAVIDINGQYVIMAVADNAQEIVDNINEIIGG